MTGPFGPLRPPPSDDPVLPEPIPGAPRRPAKAPRRDDPAVHLLLFLATLVTTVLVGSEYETSREALARRGLPFALTLLGILLAHEMGHYVTSRRRGVSASLPYFIPFPVGIGTLGAIIRMRQTPRDRGALLDIGTAGPLVGLAVAVPLAAMGMAGGRLVEIPRAVEGMPVVRYGDSLLTWLLVRVLHGDLPPGMDVVFTPMAHAAWLGLFVTALNLLPAGQFDGGHIVYALLGRKHALVSHLTFLALVTWGAWGTLDGMAIWEGALSAALNVYALFLIVSGPNRRAAKRNLLIAFVAAWLVLRVSFGEGYPDTAIWLVWSCLLYGFGLDHPPTRDLDRPLDLRRRVVGWFCLAVFVLTFIPRPVTVIG